MKAMRLALLAAMVGLFGGGCATGGAGGAAAGRGEAASEGASNDRLLQVQQAIEAQSREIADLRAALARQDRQVQADVERINESLDTHLELLDLLYRQLGQESPGTAPKAMEGRVGASVFGSAAIEQRSGDATELKHMRVILLDRIAEESWKALSSPRALYNTPIQNAGAILTALEFEGDVRQPADQALNGERSPTALNSHLRAFESSLGAIGPAPATSTRANGKYFFRDVPPGSYHIYARISPATYSVCWLVPVKVEPGGAHEVNLDAAAAMVFLNDVDDSGR